MKTILTLVALTFALSTAHAGKSKLADEVIDAGADAAQGLKLNKSGNLLNGSKAPGISGGPAVLLKDGSSASQGQDTVLRDAKGTSCDSGSTTQAERDLIAQASQLVGGGGIAASCSTGILGDDVAKTATVDIARAVVNNISDIRSGNLRGLVDESGFSVSTMAQLCNQSCGVPVPCTQVQAAAAAM